MRTSRRVSSNTVSAFSRNCLLLLAAAFPTVAAAAPSDISFDFAAAAPSSYDARTGGGAYGSGVTGTNIARSLSGTYFTCGDQITHFVAVRVKDSPIDATQTATVELRFSADSSSNAGAGYNALKGVRINRNDAGMKDDGGSTATLLDGFFAYAGTNNPASGPGPGVEMVGHILISDLEGGEQVIVALEGQVACVPGTAAAGSLKASLSGARIAVDGYSDVMSVEKEIALSNIESMVWALAPQRYA